jgi:hypothetical protein
MPLSYQMQTNEAESVWKLCLLIGFVIQDIQDPVAVVTNRLLPYCGC